jgi:hypothetical protein
MERAMPQALPSHELSVSRQGIPMPDPVPPRPTVGDAVRRYWPLLLIVTLALGAAGAYAGYKRGPVYEARAALSVGMLDITTQSVPGFAVGGEVVAGGFSRSVQTNAVVNPVARQLKMAPDEVRARITSTPVPGSPIFTVTATGPSEAEAVTLANAVSSSMIAYAKTRSNSGAAFTQLLSRYRTAVRERNRTRSRVEKLRAERSGTEGSAPNGTSASADTASSGELAQARADLEAQQLRVDSLAEQYRTRAAAPANSTVVQPLADAHGASSDRNSKMQLYGALGVLGGVCIGAALAVLFTAARHRRQRRRLAH